MREKVCQGLPASWLNAWLAAVGITVLSPRIRLGWSEDILPPRAVLVSGSIDPAAALLEAWPTRQRIEDMPIAENWGGLEPMRRKVPERVLVERLIEAAWHIDAWTLTSTMTHRHIDKQGNVGHAPLDPAGPGSIKWLHHRLLKCYDQVTDVERMVTATLEGASKRVKGNGLGFDITRMTVTGDKTSAYIDPVVEVLAFFGLKLLPVTGSNITAKSTHTPSTVRQRCWHHTVSGWTEKKMYWPAWSQPLAFEGVDALLDQWLPFRTRVEGERWQALGVHAGWESVAYQPRGSVDTTRGYGSLLLRPYRNHV